MPVFRVPINLTWQGAGSPGVNVWHLRVAEVAGAWSQGDLESGVGAIHTFYSSLSSLYPSGTTITLGDIVNQVDRSAAHAGWTQINSTGGAQKESSALQVCISWRTSIAARRAMGRTFIGPLTTLANNGNGEPGQTTLDTISAAATALVGASTGSTNGWAVGVWGLVNAAPPGTSPAAYKTLPRELRDITAFRVKPKFAVLRSRRD